jgi:glucose-1-phosphate thymidylyltransferase
MIYYPLSTLMLAGMREILIITTKSDQQQFERLLGDGSNLGIELNYEIQNEPNGLAEAFLIAEDFLSDSASCMVLGDNLFHGPGLGVQLARHVEPSGCRLFTYEVANPEDYGVAEVDSNFNLISIEEKPLAPKSSLAVTGLYYFDNRVSKFAREVRPSPRGELEITSLIQIYLELGSAEVTQLPRGTAWLDTGSPSSLHDAGSFVKIMEERTGMKIGCIEEIAFRNGWIGNLELKLLAENMKSSPYGKYLKNLLDKVQ